MSAIPTFAFVGPVNPGKTSTIATLLEDDRLRISKVPGETTECQRFDFNGADGEPIISFYDTPGFQNPRNALLKLRELRTGAEAPLDVFRKFVTKYGGDPEYAAEQRLFAPILDGAGIIYVVDASQRVLLINVDEMEILRLTGQPVLGLINWTAEPVHMQEWKNTMRVHFRVWEFNAHKASYFERTALLKTLIGLEQAWAPALERAVTILEQDWEQRMRDCADVIGDMVVRCLQHRETGRGDDEIARGKLSEKYQDAVRSIEREAHGRIIHMFKHRKVEMGRSTFSFEQDLFSARTWEILGLNREQLTWAGAGGGAAAGAVVEGMLLGHGLGIPTIIGTAVGAGGAAAGAFFGGEHLTKVKTPLPAKLRRLLHRETLGGTAISVGPNLAANFPWILIDRALIVYYFIIHRAHAQQENITLDPDELRNSLEAQEGLSNQWSKDERSRCEKAFISVRKDRAKREDRETLNKTIKERLSEIAKKSERRS